MKQPDSTPFSFHETTFTLKAFFDSLRNTIIAAGIMALGVLPPSSWSIGGIDPSAGQSQALSRALISFGAFAFALNLVQSVWQMHSVLKKLQPSDQFEDFRIVIIGQLILASITPVMIVLILGMQFNRSGLNLSDSQIGGWFENIGILDRDRAFRPIVVSSVLLVLVLCAWAAWAIVNREYIRSTRKYQKIKNDRQTGPDLSDCNWLRGHWSNRRSYSEVVRLGPELSGCFSGWFEDEVKICGEFRSKIDELGTESIRRYPAVELEYLGIVDELHAKPKPLWLWLVIVAMVVAQAYNLSVLVVGYLEVNDSYTAPERENLLLCMSGLMSISLLMLTVHIGAQAYKRRYALRVFVSSFGRIKRGMDGPGGSFVPLAHSLGLSVEDNLKDVRQSQATRMANRSHYVAEILAETIGGVKKRKVSAYSNGFKMYFGYMALMGILILTLGINAINNDYLEQSNAADIVGVLLGVLLFWLIQALTMILASSYGFASNDGMMAYRKIRAFKKVFGEIPLIDEYKKRIDKDFSDAQAEAKKLASETLRDWQSGLQSEYGSGGVGMTEKQLKVIEQALESAVSRTFDRYMEISKANSIIVGLASSDPATDSSEPSLPTELPLAQSAANVDPWMEYFFVANSVQSTPRVIAVLRLSELKFRIGEAEIDASTVYLRRSETSEEFLRFQDFMNRARASVA